MSTHPGGVPLPPTVDGTTVEEALTDSVDGIRVGRPHLSASVAFVPWQKWSLVAVAGIVSAGLVFVTTGTLTVLAAVATFAYVATIIDRVVLFRRGLASGPIRVSDEAARAVADEDLPSYTVLVPAYDEPEVVGGLVAAMESLDYPRDKLQVLLLLEEDDDVTIAAAADVMTSGAVTVLLVPAAQPRTKPKACNFGLHFATGDIVTIYDAEDVPDPLQLRRVAVAFDDLDDDVACVQARLDFHNSGDNVLTAWFTADYGLWFGFLLPGLMASRSPIPLGGTSNHLRRRVLDEIGAWDPFNVTEDADLGIRIAVHGMRTAVLDSTTWEEANVDAINWIRQRSRWYKGYLQTFLVHMRSPVRVARTLGPVGTFRLATLFAGTPLIACLNVAFWFMLIVWILGQPTEITEILPPAIYYPSLVSMILGNSATVYMTLIAIREDDRPELFWPALIVPFYWVLMGIAAVKGTWQLLRNPSYWEKTAHGIGSSSTPSPAAPPPVAET